MLLSADASIIGASLFGGNKAVKDIAFDVISEVLGIAVGEIASINGASETEQAFLVFATSIATNIGLNSIDEIASSGMRRYDDIARNADGLANNSSTRRIDGDIPGSGGRGDVNPINGADEATGRVIRDTDGPNPSNNIASGSEARAIGDTPNGIDASIEGATDNIDETVERIGETAEDIGRRVDDVNSTQINDVDVDNQVRMADNIGGEGGTKTFRNVSELSNEQIEALIKYTGDDYVNINNSLRGLDTLSPENQATVEAMKSALDNSALPQDMTLYRGTSTEALGSLQNLSVDELVGKTFTEQGFMSTSTSNVIAEGFSGNMKMTIEASKGAQALDISSISQYTTEAEVLFNAGQEMLITSAEVSDGILNITVIIE